MRILNKVYLHVLLPQDSTEQCRHLPGQTFKQIKKTNSASASAVPHSLGLLVWSENLREHSLDEVENTSVVLVSIRGPRRGEISLDFTKVILIIQLKIDPLTRITPTFSGARDTTPLQLSEKGYFLGRSIGFT